MRTTALALGLAVLSASFAQTAMAKPKPTAQSTHCTASADDHKLTGAARSDFVKSCMKGPLTPDKPTAAMGSSKEAQAITKPSGVDRTTRAKQCAAEADKKGLSAKDRKGFQLSCQATAGPVSEVGTGTKQPGAAKAIKGIGVNNNAPGAAPSKSEPELNPPAAAKKTS